jgi:hypothetical protein
MRKNYLCINPFHYGYESSMGDPGQQHFCRKHLRLQATGTTLMTICRVCRKPQNEDNLTDGFFTMVKDTPKTTTAPTTSTTTAKTTIANQVFVKTEIIEQPSKEGDSQSIEELDRDFEGMLESIEDQVKDEIEDNPLDIQDDMTVDSKLDLRLEIGPAANISQTPTASKRPLEGASQVVSKQLADIDPNTSVRVVQNGI